MHKNIVKAFNRYIPVFVTTLLMAQVAIGAKRTCADAIENLADLQAIELESLSRPTKSGNWIDLTKLTKPELKALFEEIKTHQYLIEIPIQRRGFVGNTYYKKGAWYVQFTNMMEPGKLDGPIELMTKADGETSKIQVIGAPKKIPKNSVGILATDVGKELAATGLSPQDQKLIVSHSKGVFSMVEFLANPKFKKRGKKIILLGNDSKFYRRLATDRDFEVFDTLYAPYYEDGLIADEGGPWDADSGPRKDITELFMFEALENYQIVFMIPEDLRDQAHSYGKNKGGYTYEEWRWLKNNPVAMKEVIFVVGTDNAFVPSERTLFSHTSSSREFLKRDKSFTKLLNDPIPFLIQ